jgi:formate-dependent nitrite reductase cytochrome c552 subunit
MRKMANKLAVAATLGSLMLMGVAGCSMFSASNTPVDCNVVKTQAEAGKTDAQIATDLGAKESEVASCHGPEQSGNKSSGMIPQSY